MKETYPVSFGKQTVGKVQLQREGLYYHIFCRCQVPADDIYRLNAVFSDKQESLGILIPSDGGFGLETRIPVRRIADEIQEFRLISKREPIKEGKFIPICPEEPFSYIARLKESFLVTQNGIKGIVIQE